MKNIVTLLCMLMAIAIAHAQFVFTPSIAGGTPAPENWINLFSTTAPFDSYHDGNCGPLSFHNKLSLLKDSSDGFFQPGYLILNADGTKKFESFQNIREMDFGSDNVGWYEWNNYFSVCVYDTGTYYYVPAIRMKYNTMYYSNQVMLIHKTSDAQTATPDVIVYPNPVSGSGTLTLRTSFAQALQTTQLRISSVNGLVMAILPGPSVSSQIWFTGSGQLGSGPNAGDVKEWTIQLPDLIPGLYVIEGLSDNIVKGSVQRVFFEKFSVGQ